jgi:hypothetical protein
MLSYDRSTPPELHGSRELTYYIGSNTRGRTFLFDVDGFLYQLSARRYAVGLPRDLRSSGRRQRSAGCGQPIRSAGIERVQKEERRRTDVHQLSRASRTGLAAREDGVLPREVPDLPLDADGHPPYRSTRLHVVPHGSTVEWRYQPHDGDRPSHPQESQASGDRDAAGDADRAVQQSVALRAGPWTRVRRSRS